MGIQQLDTSKIPFKSGIFANFWLSKLEQAIKYKKVL